MKPLLDGGDPPETGPNAGLWTTLGRHGHHQPDTPEEMGALLDRAGDQRFMARSAWFQSMVQEQGPDQTLYEGLLEGLGYRFNQQPFLKLAQRAPYAALVRASADVPREQTGRIVGIVAGPAVRVPSPDPWPETAVAQGRVRARPIPWRVALLPGCVLSTILAVALPARR